MSTIHPTAQVASDAIIADDVTIGAYSIIEGGVEIGDGTRIKDHVIIRSDSKIGKNNEFFQFASIGDDPQHLRYDPSGESRLEIGDGNTFREGVTVHRGTSVDNGVTLIGNDNLIMAYCHIAHDAIIHNNVVIANNSVLAGHVVLEDYVILSGFTMMHQFCHIGTHCLITAASIVYNDFPAYLIFGGNPARPVTINRTGLDRRGFSKEQISNIDRAFRMYFKKGGSKDEKLDAISKRFADSPELQDWVNSIRNAQRSVHL